MRGAFLHLAADAAVSLGVVVAGIGILFTGWLWLDPFTGLVIAVAIVWSTWGLLRDSVALTLNAVPEHIDPRVVRTYLSRLAGVAEVHDLHIWAPNPTGLHLTRDGSEASGSEASRMATSCTAFPIRSK